VPGTEKPQKRDLSPFLRRFEAVDFHSAVDEIAFKRLLAGYLGFLRSRSMATSRLDTER